MRRGRPIDLALVEADHGEEPPPGRRVAEVGAVQDLVFERAAEAFDGRHPLAEVFALAGLQRRWSTVLTGPQETNSGTFSMIARFTRSSVNQVMTCHGSERC
jgi:hypothetical protein